MEANENQSFPPNDVRRTEEHNRIDDIRPDDGATPRGVGSTDDLNAIKPWTAGSDEMAPVGTITPQGHTTGDGMDLSPGQDGEAWQNMGGDIGMGAG